MKYLKASERLNIYNKILLSRLAHLEANINNDDRESQTEQMDVSLLDICQFMHKVTKFIHII